MFSNRRNVPSAASKREYNYHPTAYRSVLTQALFLAIDRVSRNLTNSLIISTFFILFFFFTDPGSPTLEINTLEFPNEHILPTGYNITIVCTSNFSKDDWGVHKYSQPYWIQQFFNLDYIGDCGGSSGDYEDSKVCTYVIQNATERDSASYSCLSSTQIGCTLAEVYLEFQGTQQNFKLLLTSVDQLGYIKIHSKTIDLSTRLWGITIKWGFYSSGTRAEV